MSWRRLLYSLFLYLLLPFVLLRLFWRSLSNFAYRQRITERLGFVDFDGNNGKPIIWVHAVSVGETIAARPLVESLLEKYDDYRVLVTTTTPTGSERAKSLFGERIEHVYFPYDLPDVVRRFLNGVNPKILIVVETEIWPNLYASCDKRDIPVVIINARLSEKSLKAYQRIRHLISATIKSVSLIAVRSASDAERYKLLGANDQQIIVLGNIKYDIEINPSQQERGLQRQGQWQIKGKKRRKVWVAASTHEGEDAIILTSYKNLLKEFPDLILVLVPRHPERFNKVFELCIKQQQHNFKCLRHSQIDTYENREFNIIIGDTMGVMQSWFAIADVAFIGGSLVPTGGHNPLEAIIYQVPVVCGPHMFNFEDMLDELSDSTLLSICDDEQQLTVKVSELLQNERPLELGQTADKIMQQHQGVTSRIVQSISNFF